MGSVPTEIEELIEDQPLVAHLATSVNDRPHVAPVGYHYEDGMLQIATSGKKVHNVRHNPRVAVSIQKDENGHPKWMVLFEGTATVIEDTERIKVGVRNVFEHYLGDNPEEWDPHWRQQLEDPEDDFFILEIQIESAVRGV